jgi:DNA repair exonuclease SbcCD ATPase subunit
MSESTQNSQCEEQITNNKQMPTQILNNDENKIITHIVHLADIHISRNTIRHSEYEYVFNKLYNNLEKLFEKQNNCVIVICGDIVNENSRLAPNQITIVKNFFIRLCEFSDVIVILGNHDMNMNDNTTNSIGPIIFNTQTKNNLYFLNIDCNYIYHNIVFGVTTTHTKCVTKIDRIANKINVGLYHGTLHGSQIENGMTISNNNLFTNGDFADYDIVCLGDIHKFQYMNAKKTICYSSSLIQQNIGESVDEHGYVLWDLATRESKLVKIKNKYALKKISIDETNCDILIDYLKALNSNNTTNMINKTNNSIIRKIENIDDYNTIYVYYSNIDYSKAQDAVVELKQRFVNSQCVLHCEKMQSRRNDELKVDNVSFNEIRDDKTVKQLILNHIKDSYNKLNQIEQNTLNQLLDEILIDAAQVYNQKSKKIVINELLFDNYYLYGKKNSVDFSKLKGIVGLDGASHTGKSTLIDCLLYAIFGQCNRGSLNNIINVKCDIVRTYVSFNINDDNFEIVRKRRLARRATSKKKQETSETLIVKKNGKNITQDKIVETNNLIEFVVGTFDAFVNQTIILQNRQDNMITMTKAKRKEFICKMMNFDILTEILNRIRNYKNQKSKNAKLSKSDEERNIEIAKKINVLQIEHDQYNQDLIECKRKLHELHKLEGKMHSEKDKYDAALKLTKRKCELENELEALNTSSNLMIVNCDYVDKMDVIHNISFEDLTSQLITIVNEQNKLQREINSINDVTTKLQQITKDYETSLAEFEKQKMMIETRSEFKINFKQIDSDKNAIVESMDDKIKKLKTIQKSNHETSANIKSQLFSLQEDRDAIKQKIEKHVKIIQDQLESDITNAHCNILRNNDVVSSTIVLIIAIEKNMNKITILQENELLKQIGEIQIKSNLIMEELNKCEKNKNEIAKQLIKSKNTIKLKQLFLELTTKIENEKTELKNKFSSTCDKCKINKQNYESSVLSIYLSEQNKLQTEINDQEINNKNIELQNELSKQEKELRKLLNFINQLIEQLKKLDDYVCQQKKQELRITKLNELLSDTQTIESQMSALKLEIESLDELVELFDEYINLRDKTNTLGLKLNKLTEIDENNNKMIEHNEQIQHEINKLEKKKQMIKKRIEMKANHDKLTSNKKQLDDNLKIINSELAILQKYNFDKNEFDDVCRRVIQCEKDEIELLSKTNTLKTKLTECQCELVIINKEIAKSQQVQSEINLLTMLNNKLNGNSGIVNTLLDKHVLPMMETKINNLLKEIGGYSIKMERSSDTGINITKTTSDGKILDMESVSGCEGIMANLAIRCALNELNTNMRCDMLIIDEGFQYCDEETLQKIPLFFEYMKSNYKFILVISHDERIRKLYDTVYSIKQHKGFSKLKIQ